MLWAILTLIVVGQILIARRLNKMSAATDAFTAAVTKLDTDVTALVAQGSAGSQAAVDAFAQSATIAVQAVDAKVLAATTPSA